MRSAAVLLKHFACAAVLYLFSSPVLPVQPQVTLQSEFIPSQEDWMTLQRPELACGGSEPVVLGVLEPTSEIRRSARAQLQCEQNSQYRTYTYSTISTADVRGPPEISHSRCLVETSLARLSTASRKPSACLSKKDIFCKKFPQIPGKYTTDLCSIVLRQGRRHISLLPKPLLTRSKRVLGPRSFTSILWEAGWQCSWPVLHSQDIDSNTKDL